MTEYSDAAIGGLGSAPRYPIEPTTPACRCGHRLARHDRAFACTEPDCRCAEYDATKPRHLAAVGLMSRCIVHDQSYTRVCTGCAADEKAAS